MKISLVPPDLNELEHEPHRKSYYSKILSNFTWYRDLVLDVVTMIDHDSDEFPNFGQCLSWYGTLEPCLLSETWRQVRISDDV